MKNTKKGIIPRGRLLAILLGLFVLTACIIGCSGKKTGQTAENEENTALLTAASDYETDGAKYFSRNIDITNPLMEGQDVLSLQFRLTSLGFNGLDHDNGYYGANTGDAIKFINWVLGIKITNPETDQYEDNYIVDKALWGLIFDHEYDKFLTSLSLLKNLFDPTNPTKNGLEGYIDYRGNSSTLAVSELKETVIRENNTGFDFWYWTGVTKREYFIMGIPVIEFESYGHEYSNSNRFFFMPSGFLFREKTGGAESFWWQDFAFVDNERNLHVFVNGDPIPGKKDAIFLYSEYKGDDSYLINESPFE